MFSSSQCSFSPWLSNPACTLILHLCLNNVLHVILQRLSCNYARLEMGLFLWQQLLELGFIPAGLNKSCKAGLPLVKQKAEHGDSPHFQDFPVYLYCSLWFSHAEPFYFNTFNKEGERCTISITVTWGTGIIAIGECQEMASLFVTSFLVH